MKRFNSNKSIVGLNVIFIRLKTALVFLELRLIRQYFVNDERNFNSKKNLKSYLSVFEALFCENVK